MRQGTIIDFLRLIADTPALQRDLIELAAKHEFQFTTDELADTALDTVAGGTGDLSQMQAFDLQQQQQETSQAVTALTNMLKTYQDTQNAIVTNLKG